MKHKEQQLQLIHYISPQSEDNSKEVIIKTPDNRARAAQIKICDL
jgi:hypothetical protein